jgi:acyl-CoA synthetase (AMP-forming)/AMP-acid ligase II
MTIDDASWGLPGALTTPAMPEAEPFCTTPLLTLLQAAAAPDMEAIAVASLTTRLSYRDLLRLAQNAACAIAELVPPREAVACLLPRHPESIAGLLGCLIAGRPCMVLDPSDPVERQAALLQDAAPALLLAPGPVPYPGLVLTLGEALSGPDRPWRPDHEWDADAPFAIHFTSGSTGRPKGIVLSARSTLYRGLYGAKTMEVTRESRVIQPIMPVASAGLSTMLGVLALGGRVVLAHVATEGAGGVLKLIERESVTTAAFGPSVFGLLMSLQRARAAFSTVRMLRLGGGGVLSADLAAWRQVLPPGCVVLHAYASTEALNMAQWTVPADAGGEARLAAGILHLCHDYALVDEDGRPAAPGEAGELVLRSRYVALGEWRDGRLVPGRMIPVPGRPGWRFFRTGDVLRVHADGMLRVIGRADRQVKINGVIVQPAEIEAVLKAEPLVLDAAVVARTTGSGAALHGFIATTEGDASALVAALRRRLAASLPAVFRPASLTVLKQLPMLPGGKIDLVALSRLTQS